MSEKNDGAPPGMKLNAIRMMGGKPTRCYIEDKPIMDEEDIARIARIARNKVLAFAERKLPTRSEWESYGFDVPDELTSDPHPDYTAQPIDGMDHVQVTIHATGRTFQLPGNPTDGEVRAAIQGYTAGMNKGRQVGLREAWNVFEDAAEKVQEEFER